MVFEKFDPMDKEGWYFGALKRQEAQDILEAEPEVGTFLVRDSATCPGDYVLCVKEVKAIRHYIVKKIENTDPNRRNSHSFKIGEEIFNDLATLLNYYASNSLENTTLTRPAGKLVFKAMYDFQGKDHEDLPFKCGEILTAIKKHEENWWTAKNQFGQTGSVPAPYMQLIKSTGINPGAAITINSVNGSQNNVLPQNGLDARACDPVIIGNTHQVSSCHRNYRFNTNSPLDNNQNHNRVCDTNNQKNIKTADSNRNNIAVEDPHPHIPKFIKEMLAPSNVTLPAWAIVKQRRLPNAYDQTALQLNVGDVIKVTKMHLDGQWEGDLIVVPKTSQNSTNNLPSSHKSTTNRTSQTINNNNNNNKNCLNQNETISYKHGFFPFTHVTYLEPTDPRNPDYKKNINKLRASNTSSTITTSSSIETTSTSKFNEIDQKHSLPIL